MCGERKIGNTGVEFLQLQVTQLGFVWRAKCLVLRMFLRTVAKMRNEDYFSMQVENEWSLLSFLKWKKTQGLQLEGKEKEHAVYSNLLREMKSVEADEAFIRFKVCAGQACEKSSTSFLISM